MATPSDVEWLDVAIDLATSNVAEGGGPFGAVIVQDGVQISSGQNRVTRDNDPTAHAEVVAIRRACADRGDFSLAGATLYASCEPCPMCMASALWARLDRIVYAADRYDAARGGFDDLEFYELFARERSTWNTAVEAVAMATGPKPFDTWLSTADRTAY